MDDILFAKVNFPSFDIVQAAEEILAIDKTFWFWDAYRETDMLPLMTKQSASGKQGSSNFQEGDFEWLPYTPKVIKDWFEDHVFPWMGMKTRIMVFKTMPHCSNLEHTDCKLNEIGSRQHKFRVVLRGKTDTLYFKTRQGYISAPPITGPFIIDGGWPHGMANCTNDVKLTLGAGSPWTGNNSYDNIELLMKRSEYTLPHDLIKFSQ